MKKALILFIFILSLPFFGQKPQQIDMNRSFEISGTAFIYSKSTTLSKGDYMPIQWSLKNNHVAGNNYPIFSAINTKTGKTLAYKAFDENVRIFMSIKNKKTNYIILDDKFFHLRIVELDDGFAILDYSELRK